MSTTTLRETEIRPDHLRREQAARFAADVRRLLRCKDQFVQVPCPACASTRGSKAFEKFELTYVLCAECGTTYISPRPPPAVLEMYYATSENYAFWNTHIFPASEAVRREKIFRPRARRLADLCARYGKTGGVLLEVGAGFGTFCEEVRRLSLFERVIAVEPTPGLAETCRKKGLEVIQKPIEQVCLERGQIDVATSFEVLEHLFSPRDYLRACFDLLAPGGLLVLTCPNGRGFDVAVLGPASDTVDAEHLNYFHPGSLRRLIASCGFEPLEVMTPGELDAELVRKKALAGGIDLRAQPFLAAVLLDEWDRVGTAFQRFLADNGLSSHMWAIARKPGGAST